jgi:uncharacterized MAPEG superfamily protein
LLPVVCAGIGKAGRKDYNNNDPRGWATQLTGYRARALAAQANSLEAFAFFAAGVLVALHAGVAADTLGTLCWVYVAARVAYIWTYVTDRATLRSLVWLVGHSIVVALFVLAMSAA